MSMNPDSVRLYTHNSNDSNIPLLSNSSSILYDQSVEEEISLTKRRRDYILSYPINNNHSLYYLNRSKIKLRGVTTWMMIIKNIRDFGTSSHLFDLRNSYKVNLAQILLNKLKLYKKRSSIKQLLSKCMIYPTSKFYQFWNLFLFFLLLYIFRAFPFG